MKIIILDDSYETHIYIKIIMKTSV